jgi:hypothetical protein
MTNAVVFCSHIIPQEQRGDEMDVGHRAKKEHFAEGIVLSVGLTEVEHATFPYGIGRESAIQKLLTQ